MKLLFCPVINQVLWNAVYKVHIFDDDNLQWNMERIVNGKLARSLARNSVDLYYSI
jgi:hypothetical protein